MIIIAPTIIPKIIQIDQIREKLAFTRVSEFNVNDVSGELGLSTFEVHPSNFQPLAGVAIKLMTVPG
jgi:hypothetical protein